MGMRTPGTKCPHEYIQFCPLYVGMHIDGGPSCWPKNNRLEDLGCAVDQGASYENLVADFFREHPQDFAEITMAEREHESGLQRKRNMRLSGVH